MKRILLFLCAIFFTTGAGSTGIGANDTTANCDNNTLGQTSGTANVEIDWVPNTIGIRWYSDDTRLSVQSSVQSCVYDDDLYLPAQPTKTGYTFKGWEVKYVIPSEYTELEYLESDNAQWIDTNYFPNNNTGVKTKMQMGRLNGSFFGGVTGANSGFECFHYGDNILYFAYGHAGSTLHGYQGVYLNDFIEIDWNKNVINYKINDGETFRYVFPIQTFSETTQMRIFALSRNGQVATISKIKIYYFEIYDNDVLVHNFIPVRRNSDSVLGMYDSVSGEFFINRGSGSFIAGPVVQ